MSRIQTLPIDLQATSLPDRVRELTERVNDRLRLVRDTVNTNEGAGVRWTDAALPTADISFAGRLLYHDLGQGATADNLYVCLWNGVAWTWILLA